MPEWILVPMVTATRTLAILLLALLPAFAQSETDTLPADSQVVYVIPVTGNVEPGMASFLARALKQAAQNPDALVILEIDTFGGRVDAAFQIVDTILNVETGTKIAYVTTKAISAGALIALAADTLIMRSGTTIGDTEPIAISNEGAQRLGEKYQSPLRAKFRALAKRNGFPAVLAEAMVSSDMVVYEVAFPDTTVYMDSIAYSDLTEQRKNQVVRRRTIVGPGKLLTMSAQEAVELGFSEMTVGSFQEMLDSLGIEQPKIVRIEENWSEQFVRILTTIAPLLMMIGLAALYVEIRSPGFGVAGAIGILCLGLVFFGQYAVGLANYTEMLLLIVGVALLAAELFITPGFGLLGLAGILVIAIGMVLSLQGFVIPKPEFPWQMELLQRNILVVLLSMTGSIFLIFLFFRYGLQRLSAVLPGPYLNATLASSKIEPPKQPIITVGDTGIVTKPLRPSGSARFSEGDFDVIADGEFIEENAQVIVEEISGNRIVVGRKESNE